MTQPKLPGLARARRRPGLFDDLAEWLGGGRGWSLLARRGVDGPPRRGKLNRALRHADVAHLNIKFFGYELARRLAAELPPRRDTVARHVGLACKPSTQVDMEADWVAHWLGELGAPVLFHRKLWELAYVLQALHETGMIAPGRRGLGFGVGQEPIPAYLAGKGVALTITDLAGEVAAAHGWAQTGQHAPGADTAFRPEFVERADFDRLVEWREADMNAVPADLVDYDFCWSICALEHLGSIERGLTFVENALETLRPGGVAVHTTEFNIAPDGPTIDRWPTVLFQRRHFRALAERLTAAGHEVAPLDFDIGDRPMDRFIDLPPWQHDMPEEWQRWHGQPAHLKLSIDGYAATCFGLLIRKGG